MKYPNPLTLTSPDEARERARQMLTPPRRQITFFCPASLRELPLEEVRGIKVSFNDSPFRVWGVDDSWTIEKGLTRTLTAVEVLPNELGGYD